MTRHHLPFIIILIICPADIQFHQLARSRYRYNRRIWGSWRCTMSSELIFLNYQFKIAICFLDNKPRNLFINMSCCLPILSLKILFSTTKPESEMKLEYIGFDHTTSVICICENAINSQLLSSSNASSGHKPTVKYFIIMKLSNLAK